MRRFVRTLPGMHRLVGPRHDCARVPTVYGVATDTRRLVSRSLREWPPTVGSSRPPPKRCNENMR